ncbi:hypothetical protein D3C76_1466630 [compost metagenome]
MPVFLRLLFVITLDELTVLITIVIKILFQQIDVVIVRALQFICNVLNKLIALCGYNILALVNHFMNFII